jgi:polysaccharide export outer membrane protein
MVARRPLVFLLACALGACASRPRPAPVKRPTRPAEYRLAASDVVEVTVWKEPGLSVTLPVRPDGRISVPGAGELVAQGRTARELEREVAARLRRTLIDPVVSVAVKEVNGSRVFVVGEVASPGAFPLRGALSVVQAIALAGGLTEFADGDDIVVLRRAPDGTQVRISFDWDDAVAGGDPVELQPGDTIVVP